MARKSVREWSPSVEVGVLGLVLVLVTAILSSYNDFNGAGITGVAFIALFAGNYIFEKWIAK